MGTKSCPVNELVFDSFLIMNLGSIDANFAVKPLKTPQYSIEFEPSKGYVKQGHSIEIEVRVVVHATITLNCALPVSIEGQYQFLVVKLECKSQSKASWEIEFNELKFGRELGTLL